MKKRGKKTKNTKPQSKILKTKVIILLYAATFKILIKKNNNIKDFLSLSLTLMDQVF